MSITVYKLTTQDNKTRKGEHNECTWGPGVTHAGTGEGDLCGPGYIHAYLSPELAALLNPVHARIRQPKLWECRVEKIDKSDNTLKIGAISLRTVREIRLPVFTAEQRAVFAILCARQALKSTECEIPEFQKWADGYLAGKNRNDTDAAWAAEAAAMAAKAAKAAKVAKAAWAAWAAEAAAEEAAEEAAKAAKAAKAAEAAARAARAAKAAAWAATRAAEAAAEEAAEEAAKAAEETAAWAAAWAATRAAEAAAARAELDLVALAKQALKF